MSQVHQLELQSIYFDLIRSGQKTVEGRVAKSKFNAFKIGDDLEFRCDDAILTTEIIELKYFISFEAMLNYFGVRSCLPNITSVEEGIEIYRSLPNYAELESKLGVIGIRVILTDNLEK